MALGCAILRPISVGATKTCARVLLSPHSPLSPTSQMKSHRTHTPTATDARATTLLAPREPSTVLDPGSQWVGEKGNRRALPLKRNTLVQCPMGSGHVIG